MAKLPKIVATVNAAILKSLKHREPTLEHLGYMVVGSTPQEQGAAIKRNLVKWANVAKEIGIYHKQ